MTFRWARSPVAPNSARIDGSGTRSSRRPSRSTLSAGREREGRFEPRASRDSRSSRIVRGASLGRGAGRAGMGWSTGASTGVASLGGAFVLAMVPTGSLRLDLVAAELVAQRREDLRPVRVVLARAEAGEQRQGDDWGRDVVFDGVLDGPAALARVGDPALDVLEVLAVRLECATRQLEQPRPDDRALHPQFRDRAEIEVVVARVHDLEAFGVGLHQAVLDPVVDHLHVVAGTRSTDVEVATGGCERREDRFERGDGLPISADHQAIADLQAPDPARRPGIDVVDALLLQRRVPADIVVEVGVAAVDDRVARPEVLEELLDLRLGGVPGGDHHPDRPG